jgi:hypothetical protein
MDLLSPSSGQKMKTAGSSKTLFYDAFCITDYIVLNGRTTDELKRIWKEAFMA